MTKVAAKAASILQPAGSEFRLPAGFDGRRADAAATAEGGAVRPKRQVWRPEPTIAELLERAAYWRGRALRERNPAVAIRCRELAMLFHQEAGAAEQTPPPVVYLASSAGRNPGNGG